MQNIMGGVSSMFGGGGGAPTTAGNPNGSPGPGLQNVGTPQQYGQQGAAMINPATATMPPSVVSAATGTSPGSMDPLTQALYQSIMKNNSMSPYIAGLEALGPLGAKLLDNTNWQLGTPARPASPTTQQPGPLQLTPGQPPGSPLATAALIAQLL